MIEIKAECKGEITSVSSNRCGNLSDLTYELLAIIRDTLTAIYKNIDEEDKKTYMDGIKEMIADLIQDIQNSSNKEKIDEKPEESDGIRVETKVIEIKAASKEEALEKLVQKIKEGNL